MPRRSLTTGLIFISVVFACAFSPQSEVLAQNSDFVAVIIGFKQTPGAAEQAIVRRARGRIRHTYRLVPAIAAWVPAGAIEGLKRNPNVTVVEPDVEIHAIDHDLVDDSDAELINSWGVRHSGAGNVHAAGNRGAGVKVAIIDTGIDYTHPDLSANYAGGDDFVNDTESFDDTDPSDDNGHGTHVAGTIGGLDNGFGVVGMAPEVDIYALKVLNSAGSGSFSGVIAALQWCVDNGIDVTNNSYGSSQDPGTIVQAAFDNSTAAGVLHIAAAGNSGNPRGKGNNIGYPARYGSVVATTAIDTNDNRASFSSTGPAAEIAAAGVAVNSTRLGGGYVQYNGTSMASPHVAGAAALVIASGVVGPQAVRDRLTQTAIDLGSSGRDSQFGFGLLNADEAAVAPAAPIDPPAAASNPSPTDGAANVSVAAALSWAAGADAQSHDVYFGTNPSPGLTEFQGNQTSTGFDPGALANSTTYYWRVDEVNVVGTTAGAVWSFTTQAPPPLPGVASAPNPGDGAIDVALNATLSWTAGSDADSHSVYFGTNPNPDGAEFQGNQGGSSFDPGPLAASTTYYWAVDEVNSTGVTPGPVWSFTTGAAPASDTVTILKAEYHAKSGWLTIHATSSAQPAVTLSAGYVASGGTTVGPFQMVYRSTKGRYEVKLGSFGVPDPPEVTVTSSGGGSATVPVTYK